MKSETKSMYKLTCWDSEWLQKGYMCSSSVMWFESECEASVYRDNWYAENKGYVKIEWDEFIPKKEREYQFPLKIGLPIIVKRK